MDESEFIRRWVMLALEKQMVDYAMNAWRPISTLPAQNTPVIAAVDQGIAVMTLNHMGEWRRDGVPHKEPRAWMPAPMPPKL